MFHLIGFLAWFAIRQLALSLVVLIRSNQALQKKQPFGYNLTNLKNRHSSNWSQIEVLRDGATHPEHELIIRCDIGPRSTEISCVDQCAKSHYLSCFLLKKI
jgi:hypothetical protein